MGDGAFAASTRIKVEHVPYKSTGQVLTDVVGGHVTFSTFTLSSTSSFVRAGTLTGIAVSSAERMPDRADCRTPQSRGGDGHDQAGGAVAHAPRRVLARTMSPQEFTSFVAAESARWTPLIQRAGLAGKAP